jgi:hypothetical protein
MNHKIKYMNFAVQVIIAVYLSIVIVVLVDVYGLIMHVLVS